MALNPYLTQAVGKAALDSIVDSLDSGGAGTIKLYAASQAATANTAVGAQVLLATLTYSATAYGAATTADPSVATAAAITSDSSADATDTVAWARHASGGGTTIFDCSAGISSGTFDIEFNTDAFVTGATVAISSLTVTLPLHV
jgi:hypothetical protein